MRRTRCCLCAEQQDYFSLQAIFASACEVELPLWTSTVPAEDCVGCDDGGQFMQRFAAQGFAFDGQQASLIISQQNGGGDATAARDL